jgi:hypothetical protein
MKIFLPITRLLLRRVFFPFQVTVHIYPKFAEKNLLFVRFLDFTRLSFSEEQRVDKEECGILVE